MRQTKTMRRTGILSLGQIAATDFCGDMLNRSAALCETLGGVAIILLQGELSGNFPAATGRRAGDRTELC